MAVWLLLPVFGKVAGEQEEAAQVDGDTEASARLSAAMVVMVLPVLAATGWVQRPLARTIATSR